jgi:hypothetical protein
MLASTTLFSSVLNDASPIESARITSKTRQGTVLVWGDTIQKPTPAYTRSSCKPSISTKLFFVTIPDPPFSCYAKYIHVSLRQHTKSGLEESI